MRRDLPPHLVRTLALFAAVLAALGLAAAVRQRDEVQGLSELLDARAQLPSRQLPGVPPKNEAPSLDPSERMILFDADLVASTEGGGEGWLSEVEDRYTLGDESTQALRALIVTFQQHANYISAWRFRAEVSELGLVRMIEEEESNLRRKLEHLLGPEGAAYCLERAHEAWGLQVRLDRALSVDEQMAPMIDTSPSPQAPNIGPPPGAVPPGQFTSFPPIGGAPPSPGRPPNPGVAPRPR